MVFDVVVCTGTVLVTVAATVEGGLEEGMDCCGLATGREVEA
uniref:Uncharacterized protein n=1 Tax=Arundo donax TaxID=35708 RepID=A0A0A9H118_ARUDO